MVEAATPDRLPLRSFIGANRISREVVASSFPSAVPLRLTQVTDAASEAKKEVVLGDCIGKEPNWELKVKKLEEVLKKNPQVLQTWQQTNFKQSTSAQELTDYMHINRQAATCLLAPHETS